MIRAISEADYNNWISLPLKLKEEMTLERLQSWYDSWEGKVYLSFSGGIDSTVLKFIINSNFSGVESVFNNTGLEFPEIVSFAKSFEDVLIIKPDVTFKHVIDKYGYPLISKEVSNKIHLIRNSSSDEVKNKHLHGNSKGQWKLPSKYVSLISTDIKISDRCCKYLKKKPFIKYEKETGNKCILGTMASDSDLRKSVYLSKGCNLFDSERPHSTPIAFWNKEDIWDFVKKYKVPYCEIYDKGYTRTGCMFCMFGVHHEVGKNRFQLMKETHPKIYDYCINKLGIGRILDVIGVKYGDYVEPKKQLKFIGDL